MQSVSSKPGGGVSKDLLKKKKKIELVGSEEDASDYTASNFDVSEAKDKIQIIKEIDQNKRFKNYFDPQKGNQQQMGANFGPGQ